MGQGSRDRRRTDVRHGRRAVPTAPRRGCRSFSGRRAWLWLLAASLTPLWLGCNKAAGPGTNATQVDPPAPTPPASSLPASSGDGPAAAAAVCQPLPEHPVIARAGWTAPDRQLLVVGDRTGTGESDRKFERIAAHLLLVSSNKQCMLARVSLGELTRWLPEQGAPLPTALDLSVLPLGQLETLEDAVAMQQIQLPRGPTVLLVHLMRDVEWGLTERHVVPVTIDGDRMVGGQSVQEGRDSMGPPVYYGTFEVTDHDGDGEAELVMTRRGSGRFPGQVVFEVDATGVLLSREQSAGPRPDVAAGQRDGRDVDHALRVCGANGARGALSARRCGDGSSPTVRRAGSVGMADDGHMVDSYEVACSGKVEHVHVDMYHCP